MCVVVCASSSSCSSSSSVCLVYRQQIQQQACASPAWRLRTTRRWRWQLCWLLPFVLPSTTINSAAVNAVCCVVRLAMSRSFVRFVDYLPWVSVSGLLCLSFSLVFAAIYVFSRKLIFRLVAAWPDSSFLAFGLCSVRYPCAASAFGFSYFG